MGTEESEEVESDFEMAGDPVSGSARSMSAPYMAGKTFTNMFAKYANEGLPDVFDISFFGNMSGSSIAQIRSTMRYFDLIDDSYVPTEQMRTLVDANEQSRKEILQALVEEKFADALALSQNATSGQLAKIFGERGITGATVDKAIAFYLHLLEYLGVPYSSNFKKRRPSNGGTRRRRSTAKQENLVPSPAAPAQPKVATEQQQKSKYIDMLMDLAGKDGTDVGLQKDLLDRIEKALGIGESADAEAPAAGGHRDSQA